VTIGWSGLAFDVADLADLKVMRSDLRYGFRYLFCIYGPHRWTKRTICWSLKRQVQPLKYPSVPTVPTFFLKS